MIDLKEKTLFENFNWNIYNYSSRSPLRYPGGKTRALEIITSYFPNDITEFLSPFLGGGSIELYIASKNIKVFAFDIFSPLVEFWQCLLEDSNQLYNKVYEFFPLEKKEFYQLQKKQNSFITKLERAAVFFVLNRCSYSGSTLSGGMSPGHPRFTKSAIERLKNFYNPNIEVCKGDFKEVLTKYKNVFTYLDPPYLIKNSLYGKKGNTHKNFDHEGLASLLYKRDKWILSYNDSDDIRNLYKNYKIITPSWTYGMSNNKSSREVLILSKDLGILNGKENFTKRIW